MANVKITDLPAGHIARADDVIELVQDADTTAVSNQVSMEELPFHMADIPPAVGNVMDDEFVDPDLLPGGATPLWAWVNQGGSSISESKGSLLTICNFVNGQSLRAIVQNTPSTPYEFVTKVSSNGPWGVSHQLAGLVLRDSGSGKLLSLSLGMATTLRFRVNQWTNPTTHAGELFTLDFPSYTAYIKIADNGTTRSYAASLDGLSWSTLFSHATNTFLTADQVGLMWYFEQTTGNSLNNFSYFRRTI